MRRVLFGDWGAAINDAAFARAVVAIGVLNDKARRTGGTGLSRHLRDGTLTETLRWAAGTSPFVRWRYPSRRATVWHEDGLDPGALADAWSAFRAERSDLRLALDPSTVLLASEARPPGDLSALIEILAYPDARLDSVFVAWQPERHATWGWPLRLGFLDDDMSTTIGAQTSQLYPASRLVSALTFSRRQSRCHIAVLPGSLRTSLARILDSPFGESAAFVLATGGIKGAIRNELAIVQTIAREMRASGFAASVGPVREPAELINNMVYHLSHDEPLDKALTLAARAENQSLVLFLQPAFADRARLSAVARRMARNLRAGGSTPVKIPPLLANRMGVQAGIPMTAHAAAEALDDRVIDFRFAGEAHEATDLAEAVPVVEATLGAESASRRDPRFIQAQVEHLPGGAARAARAFVVGERHSINVRIGPAVIGWLNPINRAPFPDELLPVDDAEHQLTIVLSEPEYIPEPLVANVTMRRIGASTVARFGLTPSEAEGAPFRARITVTHRNRVLQTALLHAAVLRRGATAGPDHHITVEVEAVVRPILQDLAGRTRFDVALVFNHTPQGDARMLALASHHAVLRGMSTIAPKIDEISRRLSEVAAAAKRYAKGLEDKEGVALLRFLAEKGHDLYDFLIADQADPVLGERLRKATYVQIVSLTPDAYFPAEFVYEFAVPADDACLCPAALAALKAEDYTKLCTTKEHGASPSPHVCPFGFWALRRVVERHAWGSVENPPAGDYVLQAEPTTGRDVIHLAKAGVFAASNRLNDEQPGAVEALYNALRGVFSTPVAHAQTWQKWQDFVRAPGEYKSALIALPHAEDENDKYYLEIGGDKLKAAVIDRSYVLQGDTAPAPLVILLGCNTVLPQSAIDSLVGRFRRAGAGVIVGTVASVLGSHASTVAQEIVTQISDLAALNEVPFGDLLLAVRRRALGRGILMALCVGGFGDADWLVTT